MAKTIKVSEETHARLGRRVEFGETLEGVIVDLLDLAERTETKKVKQK